MVTDADARARARIESVRGYTSVGRWPPQMAIDGLIEIEADDLVSAELRAEAEEQLQIIVPCRVPLSRRTSGAR